MLQAFPSDRRFKRPTTVREYQLNLKKWCLQWAQPNDRIFLILQIETLGEESPFTKLVVNLTGVDPDDAFSTVPYEKGHTFLFYLEELVGGAGNWIILIPGFPIWLIESSTWKFQKFLKPFYERILTNSSISLSKQMTSNLFYSPISLIMRKSNQLIGIRGCILLECRLSFPSQYGELHSVSWNLLLILIYRVPAQLWHQTPTGLHHFSRSLAFLEWKWAVHVYIQWLEGVQSRSNTRILRHSHRKDSSISYQITIDEWTVQNEWL